jgi:hypothetical protein
LVADADPSRLEEDGDDAVLAIDHLVRSGQVVDAARLAGTVIDLRNPRVVEVLGRLRSDGYVEHVRMLELVDRQPAVLEVLDRSDRWTGLLTVAWLVLVGILASASTWPTSAPIVAAVLVGVALVVVADGTAPRSGFWVSVGLGFGLVVLSVVFSTDLGLVEAIVGLTFYGALLAQLTWRAARLVATRGLERRHLHGLRDLGLSETELELVRGLFDQALYGSATASTASVVTAAVATLLAWAMACTVTILLILNEASGALVGLADGFFVMLAILTTLTLADLIRIRRHPHFVSPLLRPIERLAVDVRPPDVDTSVHEVSALENDLRTGRWARAARRLQRNPHAGMAEQAVLESESEDELVAVVRLARREPRLSEAQTQATAHGVAVAIAVGSVGLVVTLLASRATTLALVLWAIATVGAFAVVRALSLRRARSQLVRHVTPPDRELVWTIMTTGVVDGIVERASAWQRVPDLLQSALSLVAGVAIAIVGSTNVAVGLAGAALAIVSAASTWLQIESVRDLRHARTSLVGLPTTNPHGPSLTVPTRALTGARLPFVVLRPRWGTIRGLAFVLFVITVATVPAGWPALVVGGAAVLVGAELWRRYRRTWVRVDGVGVTDRRMFGVRSYDWSAVAGIRRVAEGSDAGLDLIDSTGEAHHLIDLSRIGLASAALVDEVGNDHARAVPPSGAAARRRLRFFGTGALACVSIAVALLLLGAIFGTGRASVDPVEVSPGRTIWVGSDGRPFVDCPSLAGVLAGADPELCEGTLRGQLVAAVVFAAVLIFAVWAVGRARPRNQARRRGVGVSEQA